MADVADQRRPPVIHAQGAGRDRPTGGIGGARPGKAGYQNERTYPRGTEP